MSEMAIKLIEENLKSRSKSLDLSRCGMHVIPKEVTNLEWLEELIIGNGSYFDYDLDRNIDSDNSGPTNTFSYLPEEFYRLTRLKKLVIAGDIVKRYRLENSWMITKLPGLQTLHLRNLSLKEIPVGESFTSLRVLSVEENDITSIANVTFLRNLEVLRVSENQISDISAVKNLTNLRILYFDRNRVSDLKPLSNLKKLEKLAFFSNEVTDSGPLAKLKNLKILSFGNNGVTDVKALGGLTSLTKLYFQSNSISNISALRNLTQLVAIYFTDNKVEDISPLGNLTQLVSLYFNSNKVKDISPLGNLTYLQSVDFGNNPVTQIKPLAYLSLLQVFNCKGCPVKDCPADIYQMGSPVQLRAYFEVPRQDTPLPANLRTNVPRRNTPRAAADAPRRDIKLIVLGNSNAGKTNLVNYLIHGTFDGARRSTHGLEVHRWLPDGKRFPMLKDIAVSIWDFGGQEYYHGAYRLFLSANAVYVLLWCKESDLNGRRPPGSAQDGKQPTDPAEADLDHFEVRYWLDTVRHYRGSHQNGKLIVVQNKTDDPDRDKQRLDQALHHDYGIYDSFHVSLREGSRKKNGRQYGILQHFLSELAVALADSADAAQPRDTWRQVRDEVLALKEPVSPPTAFAQYLRHDLWITLPDFNRACQELLGAFPSEDTAYTLPRWLDRGGAAVFFPDIPNLQDRLFLRPDKLAEKIYEVLNQEVHKRGGEFTADQISGSISNEQKPVFLEIARHFELIFPHPVEAKAKEGYYLAPQYLPESHAVEELFKIAAKDAWQSGLWLKVPLFYYRKLLHRALLRFAADPATECRYFWKHGIMFIKNGLRVLIKGLYPNEDQHEGILLIGVETEKETAKQQSLQKEIFTEFLKIIKERNTRSSSAASGFAWQESPTNDQFSEGTEPRQSSQEAFAATAAKGSRLPDVDDLYHNLEVPLQLSYDGEYYVDHQELLRNAHETKVKANNGNVWLLTQKFVAALPIAPPKAKRVFLSYSHQNTRWLGRLRAHLAGLRRGKEIETWDDREILPGEPWDAAIRKNLEAADVFILLLSADFIASEYIWSQELSAALDHYQKRKATIIPVLLEPLDLGGLPNVTPDSDEKSYRIGDFEIIPKDAGERLVAVSLWQSQEEALAKVAERIRQVIRQQ